MDLLFSQLEAWQGAKPWGSILDAGTGRHSLNWICSQKTQRWTAVTGDPFRAKGLKSEFSNRMRGHDRVLHGNWLDCEFLKNECFDVVLADYLLGSIDGHAPYFQGQLFSRLRPLTKSALYVIGMEPFPQQSRSAGGKLILKIAALRDACILIAGHRCYREYPRAWVERSLLSSGFSVESSKLLPIEFSEKYINGQLDVCLRKLSFMSSESLKKELSKHIASLREDALAHLSENGPIPFGSDHIVKAIKI